MENKQETTEKFHIKLVCQRSGLNLGKFFPSSTMAGGSAYVDAWKQTIFLHPIFSQSIGILIHKANAQWQLEKSGKREWPLTQKQLMFLALLHASDCIIQDMPCLPSAKVIEQHFLHLIEVLSWKNDVNSNRLSFPKLRISTKRNAFEPFEAFANVGAWLQACDNCRDDYDNVVRERQRKAKKLAHVAAMRSIRKAMYSDISLKRLWNWIDVQVPQHIMVEFPEHKELFFVEDDRVQNFQNEEVEALENLVLEHCEIGNSISHEVMKRIRHIKEQMKLYVDTFEIVLEPQFQEFVGTPEPLLKDYPSRASWLVASAKWKIAQKTQTVTGAPATSESETDLSEEI